MYKKQVIGSMSQHSAHKTQHSHSIQGVSKVVHYPSLIEESLRNLKNAMKLLQFQGINFDLKFITQKLEEKKYMQIFSFRNTTPRLRETRNPSRLVEYLLAMQVLSRNQKISEKCFCSQQQSHNRLNARSLGKVEWNWKYYEHSEFWVFHQLLFVPVHCLGWSLKEES